MMWKFALFSSVKTSRQQQASKLPNQHKDVAADHPAVYNTPAVIDDADNPLYAADDEESDWLRGDHSRTGNGCPMNLCFTKTASAKQRLSEEDSFLEKFGLNGDMPTDEQPQTGDVNNMRWKQRLMSSVVHYNSRGHYIWLGIVAMVTIYNFILIVARAAFTQLQAEFYLMWIILDCTADVIYIADTLVKAKTSYLSADGIMTEDSCLLLKHYFKSDDIKLDILSILPTDLLYFVSSAAYPLVRLNKLLRWRSVTKFFAKTIQISSHSTILQVVNLLIYILIIIHWNACFYFIMSRAIGFNTDSWVYNAAKYQNATPEELNSLSNKYIYSFYWSTLTLLTIGVLIFATIIGNVGSMISHVNHDREVFNQNMDAVKRYMKIRDVDRSLEKRILSWFGYMWSEHKMLDEESMLADLPDRLRASIALHVHVGTLRKMGIFKNSELGLLMELVLKLKLQVFCPGDYICRVGDIGREMFIVKSGILRVESNEGQELATLRRGSVFGEISVLEIPGCKDGNKRVANVISVGYSDCFSLSKNHLWSLLKDYPVTRQEMINRGRQLLLTNDQQMISNKTTATSKEHHQEAPGNHLSICPEGATPAATVSAHKSANTNQLSNDSIPSSSNTGQILFAYDNCKNSASKSKEVAKRVDDLNKALEKASNMLDEMTRVFERDAVMVMERLRRIEQNTC